MAEGSKVRLVRCPKCENLLQELPGYSVYQCGGCDAFLRAKKKAISSDGIVDNYDKKKDREDYEKLESWSEKEGDSLGCNSQTKRVIDGALHNRRKERIFGERNVNLVSGSSTMAEKKQVLIDNNGLRHAQIKVGKETGYADKRTQALKHPVDEWVCNDDHGMNTRRSEFVDSIMEKGIREMLPELKDSSRSLRSRVIRNHWGGETDGYGKFYGNPREVREDGGFSNFAFYDEGPSGYKSDSFYGYGDPIGSDNLNGINRVEYLEQDRDELLRKLDELRDQLSRSYNVAEKPRERVPVDKKMVLSDPYGGHVTYNVSMQPFAEDRRFLSSPGFNQGMQKYNAPPRYVQNGVLGCDVPIQPQMLRRPPHQNHHQYTQKPPHDYFMGQYVDFNRVPLASYPLKALYHQPTCSCLRCYNSNWQVPPQAPSTVLGPGKLPSDPINSNFYMNPLKFGPLSNNHQANPSLVRSRDPLLHAGWPSDIESDVDGFRRSRPRKVVVANGNEHLCHPIAGGAPLIICCSCFELLKLPRRLQRKEKHQLKLRCGACSTVILFKMEEKRLITLGPFENKPTSTEGDDGSCEMMKEGISGSHRCMSPGGMDSCSGSFDNSGCDFQVTDFKDNNVLDNRGLNLSESEKLVVATTSSSIAPEEEKRLITLGPFENKPTSTEGDNGSCEMMKEGISGSHGCMSAGGMDSCSDSFDNSGCDFQNTDFKDNNVPENRSLNLSESEKLMVSTTSLFIASEEEESLDGMGGQRHVSFSSELPKKEDASSTFQSSSLQERFDNYSLDNAGSRCEMGNKSKRTDEVNAIIGNSTSRQNSLKDMPMETEVEVSFNDYLNSSLSQNSVEISEEDDRPMVNKGNESFLVGLIKKSFRDFSRSNQNVESGKPNVFVNGQPIPDFLVKKAEKRAGPIHPGDYWYDFRAGFWGVMGQPCLGIIPPYIEEFNLLLPANCSAGNTGVFVNGRELHQNDLDLLASRGLPTMREKFYMIEISGRVLDEDSGKELDSLGKLAPTVEKADHGFGMRVPRVLV